MTDNAAASVAKPEGARKRLTTTRSASPSLGTRLARSTEARSLERSTSTVSTRRPCRRRSSTSAVVGTA